MAKVADLVSELRKAIRKEEGQKLAARMSGKPKGKTRKSGDAVAAPKAENPSAGKKGKA